MIVGYESSNKNHFIAIAIPANVEPKENLNTPPCRFYSLITIESSS
jgi:hypothetical protein